MHELSIVEALIDQVGQELDRAGQQGRVVRLELSIGRLSGVHGESVRFAFGLLAPGTRVENADLVIQSIGEAGCKGNRIEVIPREQVHHP